MPPKRKRKINARARVIACLRNEVENQVDQWKQSHKVHKTLMGLRDGPKPKKHEYETGVLIICPVTGKNIYERSDLELDHHPIPFIDLAIQWLASMGFEDKPEDFELFKKNHIKYKFFEKRWFIQPDPLQAAWKLYHFEHVQYRWISSAGNKIQRDIDNRARKQRKLEQQTISVLREWPTDGWEIPTSDNDDDDEEESDNENVIDLTVDKQ